MDLLLPKSLRKRYRIREGDELTLLDLGGVFVLATGRSQIDDAVGKFMSITESLAGCHPPGDELAGLHNSAP